MKQNWECYSCHGISERDDSDKSPICPYCNSKGNGRNTDREVYNPYSKSANSTETPSIFRIGWKTRRKKAAE